ncbi:hypothetical protein K08M3_24190 [Vibrio alginolyticus]|uniref:Uncharacterized protein n=1 Tax=Vibrio alginolyticus TaxID=663 RepID=A0A1W6UMR3_VIBAL|nr:hypothetical protein [Vibrio alginolyticus]ARO99346.1 hypothetical protein K01M1_24130 [Vibrio alginolyticus]ARP04062.1 hypothetical protein K04M1_24280 [Vibrio alginolyticus]ARP09120.1 hypothetical protein K04M3_24290 [Vibrio alginolyticus]ARP14197.1 hypothetical protein K04M5_24190 [Vibrio alginolyticus]ARP19256.1 hypothetical protein K05K4_24320 [Vibrio alginolyticus]
MNTSILNSLSKLQTIRSSEYFQYLTPFVEANILEDHRNQILNIYAAYTLVTESERKNFSSLRILNDSQSFNMHIRTFVGFIYAEADASLMTSYRRAMYANKIFSHMALSLDLSFQKIDLSTKKITGDAQECIDLYRNTPLDNKKLNYLDAWAIKSKEGKELQVNLDPIFCRYGADFTKKIHIALKNYGLTTTSSSLKTEISGLCSYILYGFTLHRNQTLEELNVKLSTKNAQTYFAEIMDIQFARVKILGNDEKTFYSKWLMAINTYSQCFIQTGIFDAPLKPFLTPTWKEPVNDDLSFSIGGNATQKESQRWFEGIDLHIKDEEAVNTIHLRLNKDLNHIKTVCAHIFEQTKTIHTRNVSYAQEGNIKPLINPTHGTRFPIGLGHLKNTITTFYHHGIGADSSHYLQFLGFKDSNAQTLAKELALPTRTTMNAILSLLILAHPKITPSWFQEWELFDKKGRQVGFKKVGNQWVAVSLKKRRGVTLAQQEVILNKDTKAIVDFLIEHTAIARTRLKSLGDRNWRKMIIIATHNKAIVYSNLNNSLSLDPGFYHELKNNEYLPNNSVLNQGDINVISEIFSLRSLRRHRGLQIYLETESMSAVARALGHKEINLKLLEGSYLPKPLMDFFIDRVIRQFQNAILFEAMKDSQYLLDAIDISEKNISEFLVNHGISDIPFHLGLEVKNQSQVKDVISALDGMVFTISTALLQLLITIRTIVETVDTKTQLKEVVEHWYQCALFILLSLETDMYKEEEDYKQMLEDAKANPIDSSKIMRALTC